MSYKNIAVVGAGGNVGKWIVTYLLKSNFNVTALSRAESQSELNNSAVNVVKGDYNDAAFLTKALTGQDALVLAVGSGSLDTQKNLIDAAVAAGVKRIIPSEFGSDTTSAVAVKAVPFYQGKLDVIEYLKKAVAGHPATTWTSVVTGPFYDWCLRETSGLWGFDIKNKKATIYDNGTNIFDTTNLGTVSKAVSKILSVPERYHNQYVYISEYRISQQDVFYAVQQATGTTVSDWAVEYRTAESLRQVGYEKIAKQDFSGVLDLIFAALFQTGNGSDFSSIRTLENAALGLEQKDLVAVTKRVVESL